MEDIQTKRTSFVEEKRKALCPLHLMVVFQPKNKKEDIIDKDEDVPKFIEKKVKSA